MITEAITNSQRREVLRLFLANFSNIDPNAVPMTEHDYLYAPIVAQYHDPDSGRLIAAALTCRAQVATMAILAQQRGLPDGGYIPVLDKHSELDLICVDPRFRGQGIGKRLIDYLEQRLRDRGVRVWFGNATPDLDIVRLKRFYANCNFTLVPDG